mmetsp:Transcript_95855/g.200354  ORF Transcript_95855/g.200354 Transcript_95855/m.200354 type:complete len:298 (-) Transcript_95855:266-1159(-)|eukprot:CAMPEP_0206487016 /NCGR_PEP_ID=MMETSP0324_2-20121206/41362_1 /ASSEMBLY_ACC=CAM_ASM_000836 /TAXON_ID=2866 /ORGANISM="Crypthecodinium cohnii, Strain Seligo" /LENGTH=297 /DNA_ID=CAMNT_0053965361 /DNA_START=228 /DNA_END=1121 /DNA_ORIENTATION=+
MGHPPSNGKPVFCYGSLLWEPVLKVLLGKRPSARAAFLKGYKRYRVKGQRFPAIMEDPNAEGGGIRGVMFEGLEAWQSAAFDEFEEEEYEKRLVPVVLPKLGEEEDALAWSHVGFGKDAPLPSLEGAEDATAWAYIWVLPELLDTALWHPAQDFIPYQTEYLVMCDRFVRDELPEELYQKCMEVGSGLTELRLSSSRGTSSSIKHAEELLAEKCSQGPAWANLMRIAGMGNAIPLTAAVAAALEAKNVARIESLSTEMVPFPSDSIGASTAAKQSKSRPRVAPRLLVYVSSNAGRAA